MSQKSLGLSVKSEVVDSRPAAQIGSNLSVRSRASGLQASKQTSSNVRRKSNASFQEIFKGQHDQQINHTIRRVAQRQQASPARREHVSDDQLTKIQARKRLRRLSRISLGKNLTLSQSAGLKLQWTVVN